MAYWHTEKMDQMEMTDFECNKEQEGVCEKEEESMEKYNTDDGIFDRSTKILTFKRVLTKIV